MIYNINVTIQKHIDIHVDMYDNMHKYVDIIIICMVQ